MTSYSQKDLETVVAMKVAGKGWKEVLARTGVPRSPAMLAWYRHNLKPGDVVDLASLTDEQAAARVATLRAAGHSWGQIALRCNVGETAVRNRFGKATGIAAEGTRNGNGGRLLNREPRYYTGNHKGFGVEAPRPLELDPAKVAAGAEKATSKLPKVAAELAKGAPAKRVRQPAAKKQGAAKAKPRKATAKKA